MVDEATAARFAQVARECAKTSKEALENAEKFIGVLKNAETGKEGISLLDVKNREMLCYMAELSLLMSQMSCGRSIKDHPAILERIRPIEQKMRSQIDKLVQSLNNGEAKASLRARPDQMEFDDDNEESEEDQDNEEDNKKPKKYVPPKMMAKTRMGREAKAMEKAKRRALQSSLVQELRQQYSDAPEEFREKSQRKFNADKERERYEEDHFVRLRMSKAEKKREQRLNRDNAMDDLFNFGNYMMRDESGEALSNKKRKGGPIGGPKGKKSRFDRKKSQKMKLKSKNKAIKRRT
ncbi:Sas10/Utp3/C1D family protein [Cooperia oncophora]